MFEKEAVPEYFEIPNDPDNPSSYPDRQFMRNPMYRHKDPIQSIIKSGDYGNGIPTLLVRSAKLYKYLFVFHKK